MKILTLQNHVRWLLALTVYAVITLPIITLPAMTKLGYPKRLAAAVEAVASSGGRIMPFSTGGSCVTKSWYQS